MDVMKRSHRFFCSAAFGTLAHLCATIVFDAKHAFNYDGPVQLKGLITFFPVYKFILIFHLAKANE